MECFYLPLIIATECQDYYYEDLLINGTKVPGYGRAFKYHLYVGKPKVYNLLLLYLAVQMGAKVVAGQVG